MVLMSILKFVPGLFLLSHSSNIARHASHVNKEKSGQTAFRRKTQIKFKQTFKGRKGFGTRFRPHYPNQSLFAPKKLHIQPIEELQSSLFPNNYNFGNHHPHGHPYAQRTYNPAWPIPQIYMYLCYKSGRCCLPLRP